TRQGPAVRRPRRDWRLPDGDQRHQPDLCTRARCAIRLEHRRHAIRRDRNPARLMRAMIAVCAAAVVACGGAPERTTDRFPALGTLVEITLIEADADRRAHALRDARAVLARASRDWHAWADGELARVNAGAAA